MQWRILRPPDSLERLFGSSGYLTPYLARYMRCNRLCERFTQGCRPAQFRRFPLAARFGEQFLDMMRQGHVPSPCGIIGITEPVAGIDEAAERVERLTRQALGRRDVQGLAAAAAPRAGSGS